MKLSPDHVAMPRDDYYELQAAADNQPPMSTGQRVASTVHSTAVVIGIAAAVTAGSWGWAKAVDWLEDRRLKRDLMLDEARRRPLPDKK